MTSIWNGCYNDGWQGKIVLEAFAHPAKFSRGLIHHIYEHAFEMGWVKAGDYCLDPFSGVALGAVDALAMGLHWVGVELEDRFVKLGEQNIELWRRQLRGWPGLGSARIIQGDSRNLKVSLCGVLETINKLHTLLVIDSLAENGLAAGLLTQASRRPTCVSGGKSMPKGDREERVENRDSLHSEIDLVVSSPPYSQSNQDYKSGYKYAKPQGGTAQESYGHTPGNLANMKEGDIDLLVSSPPYADVVKSGEGTGATTINKVDHKASSQTSYCHSPGQLASMPEGFDLIASSPPYEGILPGSEKAEVPGDTKARLKNTWGKKRVSWYLDVSKRKRLRNGTWPKQVYTEQRINLGHNEGDTFWAASKFILQQCYELLRPGGHAIWVTKAYCKKGAIVDFPGRWKALCESVGFKTVCEHRAMLVKEYGDQVCIDGSMDHLETRRISFFRRLAEKKGAPKIEWEMIQCLVKEG